MPRTKRIISCVNVYHVIMRGNNKQDIFLERKDYIRFINILKKYKQKYGYEIYCYILMTNHVHMIINCNDGNISQIIHSIALEYSIYFNNKYERCGHVFQDRFKSKAVESQEYLLNLQRYIHLNCVKAGIDAIDKYEWSSYKEYIYNEQLCTTKTILNLFGNGEIEAKRNFIIFNNQPILSANEEDIAEFEIKMKLTDEEAIQIINDILKREKINKISNCSLTEKNKILKECLEIRGISIRQIARILQIDRKQIKKIIK